MDMPTILIMPKAAQTEASLYRAAATEFWTTDKLEIDDEATVSVGEGGAWIQAWVWVSSNKAGIENESRVEHL